MVTIKYLPLALLLSGCATTEPTQIPLVPEPAIRVNESDWTYWSPKKKVAPVYPIRMQSLGKNGCANVSYVVTRDGSVANPVIVKAIPKYGFQSASINAAMQFVYTPTEHNATREPVRTSNTFTYVMADSSKEKAIATMSALREACRVDLTKLSESGNSPESAK
tara:strand:+ start:257645 stop:258136 length:492 start_codon:yes stop_codon:yes gene_type:complete